MTAVKRGRGRPSEGERVEVRIPADLLAAIDHDAVVFSMSRAELIRRTLLYHYRTDDVTS